VPADDVDLDVSVVLPVYNENGNIQPEISRIRAALDDSPYSYELIVVDDGSTDGSVEELAGIPDVRLIRFHTNRGSGSARRAGTRVARGRVVVWTDVDMTYPNERIPQLVKELDTGFDQVVGARTSEQGTVRVFRVPAKWFIRKLASYLTETDIPDLNSGLRVFRREVGVQYLHQLPRGFSCVTTMTLSFLSDGYSVGYVPIEYAKRAGRSKFHWWDDTKRYLVQVIRMVLSYSPLRIFLPIGLALLAIGTGKFVYDVVTKNFGVATNTLLLLFAGFQVIVIGLLADLVVRQSRRHDLVEPSPR
jgi:glycosyltransferase involved in cell wall biosynthesis